MSNFEAVVQAIAICAHNQDVDPESLQIDAMVTHVQEMIDEVAPGHKWSRAMTETGIEKYGEKYGIRIIGDNIVAVHGGCFD